MKFKKYADDFFKNQAEGAYKSARNTIPLIYNLFHPRSVIDLGCGVGPWLKAFQESGVHDMLGVEGDYVKDQQTYISKEHYFYHDLKSRFSIDRKFDLAMSLEVGEHLPSASSEMLVSSLCTLSDVVLFSAAIIGQEGTLHINEQLPEYWCGLFKKYNYVPVDYVRPRIWDNEEVEIWYRQNILLYVNEAKLDSMPEEIRLCRDQTSENYLFRVHPVLYMRILKRKYPYHFANYWWYKLKRSLKKY